MFTLPMPPRLPPPEPLPPPPSPEPISTPGPTSGIPMPPSAPQTPPPPPSTPPTTPGRPQDAAGPSLTPTPTPGQGRPQDAAGTSTTPEPSGTPDPTAPASGFQGHGQAVRPRRSINISSPEIRFRLLLGYGLWYRMNPILYKQTEPTTDIFLKEAVHAHPDNPLIDLSGVDKILFNTCPHTSDRYNYPYSSLVHEAGHALGIYPGHPEMPDSIMNYSGQTEPDCSPHPLDIMAIYALYQSVD